MKKLVVVFLILIIFTTGCSVKKVEELTDSEKFAKEYNISKNNPFVYSSYKDIVAIFKKTMRDKETIPGALKRRAAELQEEAERSKRLVNKKPANKGTSNRATSSNRTANKKLENKILRNEEVINNMLKNASALNEKLGNKKRL